MSQRLYSNQISDNEKLKKENMIFESKTSALHHETLKLKEERDDLKAQITRILKTTETGRRVRGQSKFETSNR